jgi:ankyrin repeat protein
MALCLLRAAVWNDHAETLLQLLAEWSAQLRCELVEARHYTHEGPLLRYAAHRGNVRVTSALVQFKAQLDGGFWGPSPLEDAAHEGHIDVMRVLLDANADVHGDAGRYSKTPVMSAAVNGGVASVQFLVTSKADVNAGDEHGATAMYYAAYNAEQPDAVLQVLLDAKAHVDGVEDLEDPLGMSLEGRRQHPPLCGAAGQGHMAAVSLLLGAKADVNATDHKGQTPLCAAAAKGHVAVIAALLASKAALNVADEDRKTPLQRAVAAGHSAAAALLQEAGRHA